MLTVKEIERKLQYVKQRNFEQANKPGKWLAFRLRKEREKKMIIKIKEDNTEIIENKKIKEVFYNFFSNLYQKQEISVEKNGRILNETKTPKALRKPKINTE